MLKFTNFSYNFLDRDHLIMQNRDQPPIPGLYYIPEVRTVEVTRKDGKADSLAKKCLTRRCRKGQRSVEVHV